MILNLQLIHESFLYTFQVVQKQRVDLTISQIAPLLSSQVDYQVIFKTMFDIFFSAHQLNISIEHNKVVQRFIFWKQQYCL